MTVADVGLRRGWPPLSLAGATLIMTLVVPIPRGLIAAYRQGGWIDRVVMGFSVAGFSVPVFVLGYLLIYVFAVELKWLPVQGYRSISAGLWPFLEHLILPSLTLSVIYIEIGRASGRERVCQYV